MNTSYFNPLGLISDGYIYINNNNSLTRLECNQVRNVYLKKEKKLTKNYNLFLAGILLFSLLFTINNILSIEVKSAGYLIAFILVISALKTKNYNYKIIIITKNQDIIKANIEPEYKKDAKEFISHLKQLVKSKQTILKAI